MYQNKYKTIKKAQKSVMTIL
ncbi:hypothetical protein [Flavobacterium frigidimaris]